MVLEYQVIQLQAVRVVQLQILQVQQKMPAVMVVQRAEVHPVAVVAQVVSLAQELQVRVLVLRVLVMEIMEVMVAPV